MVNIVLTAVLTAVMVGIISLAVVFFMIRLYRQEKIRFLQSIRAYFESPGPERPSEFSQVTAAISQQFAASIVSSLKGSFMGMQSVDSRNVQRLENDLANDMLQMNHPLVATLLDQFPAVKRRIMKNPELLQTPQVQALISRFTRPAEPRPDDNNHTNNESSFKGVY